MFSNWKIETIVAAIGLSSALAISLGYVFQLGFLSVFDGRLLQFLSIEDFIDTSATYVFFVPVLYIVFSFTSFSDFLDVHKSWIGFFSNSVQGDQPLSERARSLMLKTSSILAGIFAMSIFLGIFLPFAPFISRSIPTALFATGFMSLGLASFAISLAKSSSVRERQWSGLLFVAMFLLAGDYLYGLSEGRSLADESANNVHLELQSGRNLYGILIGDYLVDKPTHKP